MFTKQEFMELARKLDAMPIEAILTLLSMVGNDLAERGEPVACVISIALAAREVGDEDELHQLVHAFDQKHKTQERFEQLAAQVMNSRPPDASDLNNN